MSGSTPGETAIDCYELHPRAAWRVVGGEVFVVTDDRAFHRLKAPTAVDLFRALAERCMAAEALASLLRARYDVAADRARQDVDAFLATLLERRIAVARLSGSPVREGGGTPS